MTSYRILLVAFAFLSGSCVSAPPGPTQERVPAASTGAVSPDRTPQTTQPATSTAGNPAPKSATNSKTREIASDSSADHLLFVASPRKYIFVYDVKKDHKFVRAISLQGFRKVRGITAESATKTLYVTYRGYTLAVDIFTGELKWKRNDPNQPADRLEVTPDGTMLFVPAGLKSMKPYWYVFDPRTVNPDPNDKKWRPGKLVHQIEVKPGAHNTLISKDGKSVYMASLKYEYLTIVQADEVREAIEQRRQGQFPVRKVNQKRVGPFAGFIRPFTVNSAQDKVYANVQGVLGYQVADLKTGEILGPFTAEARDKHEPHHATPSHGIGLTYDESEVWVADSAGDRILVFDAFTNQLKDTIDVGHDPGWITFDMTGTYGYASSGEIIRVADKKVIGRLLDPNTNEPIVSEKMIDMVIRDKEILEIGSQYGIGRKNF